MSAEALTERQRKLLASVALRASTLDAQRLILPVEASRIGASETDVRTIREVLQSGAVKDCRG